MIFQIFNNLRTRLKHERAFSWLLKITALFFLLLAAFAVLFKYAEDVIWEEAVWQSWQTFTTVGYGNRPAETTLGRWLTMIISTVGIAVLGAVFTAVFDYRQKIIQRRRIGFMDNPYKNGYVIFNFPGVYQITGFIKELRNVEKDVGICVVDSSLEELPLSVTNLERVHFISGNTLSRETYQKARLRDNKAVIVFPKQPSVPDSDGSTKTIVTLVSKFVKGNTRILHVLVDPSNSWMFEDVESTQVMESFELFALVQECQDIYSSEIVEQLLLNTEGANPKTCSSEGLEGWTWAEFSRACSQVCDGKDYSCNPLAIIKNGFPNSCPHNSTVIEKGDMLSIIANNDFNWKKFLKELHALRQQ